MEPSLGERDGCMLMADVREVRTAVRCLRLMMTDLLLITPSAVLTRCGPAPHQSYRPVISRGLLHILCEMFSLCHN